MSHAVGILTGKNSWHLLLFCCQSSVPGVWYSPVSLAFLPQGIVQRRQQFSDRASAVCEVSLVALAIVVLTAKRQYSLLQVSQGP
jgi:hypothetical protein